MGQALLMISRLEILLRDFSDMRVHRHRPQRSMVSTQWRSANVSCVNSCEVDSMHAYSDCDKHSTSDSLCATKKELGHWDTILQTQSEIVHLTSMGDFICSLVLDQHPLGSEPIPDLAVGQSVEPWPPHDIHARHTASATDDC